MDHVGVVGVAHSSSAIPPAVTLCFCVCDTPPSVQRIAAVGVSVQVVEGEGGVPEGGPLLRRLPSPGAAPVRAGRSHHRLVRPRLWVGFHSDDASGSFQTAAWKTSADTGKVKWEGWMKRRPTSSQTRPDRQRAVLIQIHRSIVCYPASAEFPLQEAETLKPPGNNCSLRLGGGKEG